VTPRTRTARALGWLVPLTVWAVSISRGAVGPQWRADLPALRDRGLAGVGFGGTVSSALTQLFGLLPLGSQSERAAAASTLAVTVASWLLFRIGFRTIAALLQRSREPLTAGGDRFAGLLAAVAGLTCALSPSWQGEATVGGGAGVALALALALLDSLSHLTCDAATLAPDGTRRWLMVSALLGVGLAESPPAAGVGVVVGFAMLATAERRPALRLWSSMTAIAVLAAAVVALPVLWRPFAPGTLDDLERVFSTAGLRAVPKTSGREAVLSWVEQLGFGQLALAGIGLVIGAARARQRTSIMLLVALPLLDLVAPSSQWLDGTPTPLRQLCVASFALAATLGVAEVVVFLRSLELALARFASVLAVVFHMTLAAVVCEEASFTTDRTSRVAAEEWTDQALERLPRDAALVVRSPDLAWRLWTAQRVEGHRPDVLLVASPLLLRSAGLARLLPHGPEVAPIVRDLALTGSASEYGLSVLADARPLLVELDASWDPRMLAHVELDGTWLRFDAAALGASDRASDGASALATEAKIAAHVQGGARRDAVSAEVVGRTLKEQMTALSLVGLAEATPPLLDELERLVPGDPFVVSARLRVSHAVKRRRGASVELRDLLRF